MMLARDVMNTRVVTVGPDATVTDIAKLLVEKRISAVPVVDADQGVMGIVSEGDLMHRPESGTEKRRGAWWLRLLTMPDELAAEYSKSHGVRASDVMTRTVITVPEGMPIADIAEILEEHRIKRVPVVQDGRLVGIVSRANLLHGLATSKQASPLPSAASDQAIREDILRSVRQEPWASPSYANVTVEDGVVHLWGMAETDEEIKAWEIAAGETTGVKSVANHMNKIEPRMFFGAG
jgi:CBS domain-containing protein